jgi:hypothetical protein
MANLNNNKMNSNMDKLNKLKAMAAKKNTKVVCIEKLTDERTNEVLEKVYDGSIELKQLLNITENIIDMNKCKNPIQVMQKIYSAGSEVGPTTTRGQNAYMIDVTTDEGFEAFKSALVMLKDQDTHVPYKTVWKEGYNMFTFEFENGKHYVYYVVTNEDIAMLRDRIQAMSKSKMTKEDARALQADLPPFIRAFQESSIDVSKDKDKVFTLDGKTVTIKTFLNSIAVYSNLTKTNKDSISFGFDAVKQAKHAGKIIPEFRYTNEARDAAKPVMDLMGHVTKALEETATAVLNKSVKDLYAVADNKLYEPFLNDVQISRELAYFIKRIYSVCYAARTEDMKITKEEYETMRNVIYSKAVNLGVNSEDVIRIAIAAAMTTVTKQVAEDNQEVIITKDANVDRFKQYPVINIFPDEFVTVVGDTVVYDTYKPEECIVRLDRDIEDNEEITFANGVSEDGMIELNIEFTGTLIEYEGNFVHFKDVYAFDYVDAFITNNTFKEETTTESLMAFSKNRKDKSTTDKGAYLNSIINNFNTITVKGKNSNILVANGKYIATMDQTGNITKGTEVNVVKPITYVPSNEQQQVFIFVVSTK